MKNLKLSMAAFLAFVIMLQSCKQADVTSQQDALPKTFGVDIPSSISNNIGITGGRLSNGRVNDVANGNAIYKNLNTFVSVGEGSAQLVQAFIAAIRKFNINKAISVNYVSDDDKRSKNLVVTEKVSFEGATWDLLLTITDAESEKNSDGGKGLQIFWNKTSNVNGIAIIKPYNCNRVKDASLPNAIFRIDYAEGKSASYDAEMVVTIVGLPTNGPSIDQFSINNLKMFAGKKGNVVDVYGNSNHPNAKLFSNNSGTSSATGFNWAFVATGSDPDNIGVAEVGLPASTLDNSDRTVLLKVNSIKNTFTREINAVYPGINQNNLDAYLVNTNAPGYFKQGGFVSAGTSPDAAWTALAPRIETLTPYNPKVIGNLTLSFK
jgi:hypothetical protein